MMQLMLSHGPHCRLAHCLLDATAACFRQKPPASFLLIWCSHACTEWQIEITVRKSSEFDDIMKAVEEEASVAPFEPQAY